jgi:excisionase family DNA binding protein
MDEFLTAGELAQALKIKTPTVRLWTAMGMPCLRCGGRLVRFQLAEVVAWLKSRSKK